MRTRILQCAMVGLLAPFLVAWPCNADPIPIGAPLDGRDHTVTIDEGNNENSMPMLLGFSVQLSKDDTVFQKNQVRVFEPFNSKLVSDTIFLRFNPKTTQFEFFWESDTGAPDTEKTPDTNENRVITNPNDGKHVTYTFNSPAEPTPEPSTFVLIGTGALGLVICARWRKGIG
jgi:hypothetical protein